MWWISLNLLKKLSYLVVFALFFVSHVNAIEHRENGTDYGDQGINIYAQMKHGPDGALFLDPYFIPYLLNLKGQVLLDAGCGAGPWSIIAAKNGAVVYAIDIQEGMIAKAKQAALEELVDNNTNFVIGDVGQLPYPDNFFDRAISINVGCNLPCLGPHLRELRRVLKEGGLAIITAPNSFGTVFTDGKKENAETVKCIQQLLIDNQASFPQIIRGLDEVYRATFAKESGQWTLVLDETQLKSGEAICRKIPLMVVPNYYHSMNEYLNLFEKENFRIKEVYNPRFLSAQEWQAYNEKNKLSLGKEYVVSSPFVIFIIEK